MEREEKGQGDIPEYQPGDKIYKLFSHDKVLIKGQDEVFIIEICKLKNK